jgi:hypothetical protein
MYRCLLSCTLGTALFLGAGFSAGGGLRSADLIDLGKRVEKRVTALRGLPAKRPVRWEVTSKPAVRAYVKKAMSEQYGPGELRKEGLAMQALGLLPETMDYPEFIIGLLEEQVGGYYDPKKEVFFLADWIAPAMQEGIIAHELCHALQDQHFDLDKFVERQPGDADGMLARAALVEGEATLVMMIDSLRKTGVELDPAMLDMDGPMGTLMMGLTAAQFPEFAKAPRALREGLMFPYLKGLGFIAHGRKLGGWKRIDRVYADLPRSSEQVLHPEKYFDQRDEPQLVSLDFLEGIVPEAFEILYEDVLGEFMTLHLLDAIGDRDEERQAAAGWDGDRVRVLRHEGRLAWVGWSVWDEAKDAVEFAGAFAKTVMARRPGFARQPVGAEPVLRFVHPDRRQVLVARLDRWVLVVDCLPVELSEKILGGARQSLAD